MRWWKPAGLAALLALAVAMVAFPSANAEHTHHHRYFVTGTVTNALGEPVCGVVVRAADVTSPNADDSDNRTSTTDGQGHYAIQLHMHDGGTADSAVPSEIGNTIRVNIGSAGLSNQIVAIPNANNPNGWGQQIVDFNLPSTSRGSCEFGSVRGLNPSLIIGIVAATLLAVVLAAILALMLLRRRPASFCSKCGSPVSRESVFCGVCGFRLR